MDSREDQTFEKLDVWRRSHALSIEIYQLLGECKDWGFRDQITRSANSISDNIAEGTERLSRAEFRQFLGIAKGSAGETRSQVLRTQALSYIPPLASARHQQELREISRMIYGLIKHLEH